MVYYVSGENVQKGMGTKNNPFQTIGQAADIARAGDRIVIGKGIYREWVDPKYGGLSDEERVTYINAKGETPVISGAEVLKGWEHTSDGLWKKEIGNALFGDYNPFSDAISGDWYDDFGQIHHTGEVYIDGKAMCEVASLEDLHCVAPKDKAYRWYAVVTDEKTVIWGDFQNVDPNTCVTEINVRPCCFFPKTEGVNYITVSGIWIRQAATQWAPPTAFQQGALGTHWSKGWVIENCMISDSKCCGISIGKRREASDNIWSLNPKKGGAQTYTEAIFYNLKRGWCKDTVGSHQIRNNEIYNCGQNGIVGNMGGAFSLIEGNHIHDINNRREFGGAEIAGIKLHSAIDAVIAGNCIHDCLCGLWLDWQAQGTRVSRNVFFANAEQDLFIEVCHGPCVIDNNLFLSEVSLLNVSQGSAFVHNLFAGKLNVHNDTNRFTLYHLPHDTFVGGVMLIYGGDDRISNNIFIGKNGDDCALGASVYNDYCDIGSTVYMQTDDRPVAYTDKTLPVDIHDNVYINAHEYKLERNATKIKVPTVKMEITKQGEHYYLATNLFDCGWGKQADPITSDTLGKAFESDARYENADGSPLRFNEDFTGNQRGEYKTCVGPFEERFTTLLLDRTIKRL